MLCAPAAVAFDYIVGMPTRPVHERRTFRLRRRLRKLSRFRFYQKVRRLRQYDVRFREQPGTCIRYVLFDPETENFTYDLGNIDELTTFLATALGTSGEVQRRYIDELLSDSVLQSELRAKTRWRFSMKTHLGYGRRLGWYALIRTLKPTLAIETGIHDGLGSAVLLSALERNAKEGGPDGRLLSFDPAQDAGWLVPERLRRRWSPIFETSDAALEREVRGKEVGFMLHDSLHTYETETFELQAAFRHSASVCALVSDNPGGSASRDVGASLGVPYHLFVENPSNHWFPGAALGLAIVSQP